MADKKVEKDTSIARKAYGIAMKSLREAHSEEFEGLLDEAYASLGAESPRKRREANRAAAEAARVAAARKREERKAARIAGLEAELAALRGESAAVEVAE